VLSTALGAVAPNEPRLPKRFPDEAAGVAVEPEAGCELKLPKPPNDPVKKEAGLGGSDDGAVVAAGVPVVGSAAEVPEGVARSDPKAPNPPKPPVAVGAGVPAEVVLTTPPVFAPPELEETSLDPTAEAKPNTDGLEKAENPPSAEFEAGLPEGVALEFAADV
jgi:hypothetical protein